MDRIDPATAVLALHLVVIAFNVFGLIVPPLGAWRGWSWVRRPGWRLAHLASMAVVAVQAAAGRACFLTLWQDELAGDGPGEPLIATTVNRLVFWPLPLWVFAALYLVLFAYAVALLWLVPLRRGR